MSIRALESRLSFSIAGHRGSDASGSLARRVRSLDHKGSSSSGRGKMAFFHRTLPRSIGREIIPPRWPQPVSRMDARCHRRWTWRISTWHRENCTGTRGGRDRWNSPGALLGLSLARFVRNVSDDKTMETHRVELGLGLHLFPLFDGHLDLPGFRTLEGSDDPLLGHGIHQT